MPISARLLNITSEIEPKFRSQFVTTIKCSRTWIVCRQFVDILALVMVLSIIDRISQECVVIVLAKRVISSLNEARSLGWRRSLFGRPAG